MTQSDYMINNPTETVFEDVIAAYLAASPLYISVHRLILTSTECVTP